MPTLTDLTVKKNDGSTDIVYNVLQKAGSDGLFAKLRQDTGNANPPASRPQLWLRTLESAAGVRRVEVRFNYPQPYTDTTTGLVVNRPGGDVHFRNGVWTVPQDTPTAIVNEAASQLLNLMNHAILRDSFKTTTPFV